MDKFLEEYEQFWQVHELQWWCWACGRDDNDQPRRGWYAPWFLQRAHLGSGSGSCFRKLDSRAVIVLCPRCHMLHGGARLREGKLELPPLTNANTIWLKLYHDPSRWDAEYMQSIWIGRLPVAEPPDMWFIDEYDSRRRTRGARTAGR